MSPEEYIASIEDGEKKQIVALMLTNAVAILEPLNIAHQKKIDTPFIRISSEQDLNSYSGYCIYITEGLIDSLYQLKFGSFLDIMNKDEAKVRIRYTDIPSAILIWVVAHEYFHLLRQHSTILKNFPNDREAVFATEFDADLLAIALLFRLSQDRFRSMMSTLEIRQVTLYFVFWALRTFPEPCENPEHLSSAIRIWHIVQKLATITEIAGPDQVPDHNFTLPETVENIKELSLCLKNCEEAFLNIYGPIKHGSLLLELKKVLENLDGAITMDKWHDEMKDLVSVLSGTRT